jgi:hypothetical protein
MKKVVHGMHPTRLRNHTDPLLPFLNISERQNGQTHFIARVTFWINNLSFIFFLFYLCRVILLHHLQEKSCSCRVGIAHHLRARAEIISPFIHPGFRPSSPAPGVAPNISFWPRKSLLFLRFCHPRSEQIWPKSRRLKCGNYFCADPNLVSGLGRWWAKKSGGERGIRTLGAVISDTHDFQSCSFSQLGHLSA